MQKLYCYVDETGQDARSTQFLVTVVIVSEERDMVEGLLEKIEQESGKGKVKWISARDSARVEYIKRILATDVLRGKIYYAVYPQKKEYLTNIVVTTARAVTLAAGEAEYRATVVVDGLPKAQVQRFGNLLHQLNIKTRKVRGVKDESSAFIRLADALSGFIRAASEGRAGFHKLLEQAQTRGFIREL